MQKNIIKNITFVTVVLLLLLGQFTPIVYGLPTDQKRALDSGAQYFNTAQDTSCLGDDTNLVGSNNAEKIFNFFIGKGLEPVHAAGAYGNIMHESSGDPQNIQDTSGGRSRNPEAAGGGGWGLIQWTPGSKIIGLAQQAGIKEPIYTLSAQLELIWHHMNNDPVVTQPFDLKYYKTLNSVEGVNGTVAYFEDKIEGAGVVALDSRLNFAKEALEIYGSGAETNPSSSPDDCSGADSLSGANVVRVARREYRENKGIMEYGGDILKYTDGRQEAWCADFVSWVYKDAGSPFKGGIGDGGWQHPSVLELQSWFKSKHIYFEVGDQKPKPGDVAFYIGAQTPDGGSTQHVNLVISVKGSTMVTIGGNESQQLRMGTRTIALGSNSLVGFGRIKQ